MKSKPRASHAAARAASICTHDCRQTEDYNFKLQQEKLDIAAAQQAEVDALKMLEARWCTLAMQTLAIHVFRL